MFDSTNEPVASQQPEPSAHVAMRLEFGQRKRAEIACAQSLVRLTRLMPITVFGESVE